MQHPFSSVDSQTTLGQFSYVAEEPVILTICLPEGERGHRQANWGEAYWFLQRHSGKLEDGMYYELLRKGMSGLKGAVHQGYYQGERIDRKLNMQNWRSSMAL